MSKLQRYVLAGTRYSDVFLAIGIVAILSLMIVPVSPAVVDALLAANLGLSVVMLMLSLYIPRTLSFSTFPSMLLFTTLFRLAMNITTTRLILLHGDAGDIILTFGQFVVGGNFVVGAVIFLIITIVQFIVITKGAERVSEVGARFTLDAMPGKQMSIDADMRAGVINIEQARERREELSRESQLYGSMDGAMKFVKGDAIAGLIITAINLVGGIAIGAMQKGYPLEKAVQKYSILSIGDGLVSQIPALLIAITSGIIVTRVSTSEGSDALGRDIAGQFLAEPKAVLLGAFMLGTFALIPGFPKPQFLMLALVVGGVGYVMMQKQKMPADSEMPMSSSGGSISALAPDAGKAPVRKSGDEFSLVVPLMVDVSMDLEQSLQRQKLNDELRETRRALYHDLGVPFPGIHLRFNDGLTDGQYLILIQEVPMAQGKLMKSHVLVLEDRTNLEIFGINPVDNELLAMGRESFWVPESEIPRLMQNKISYMDHSRVLTFHLSMVLRRYGSDFLGIQETKFLLDKMDAQFPEVVREVQRVLTLQKITEVLQRLVQEEVCIRDLRTIMQTLIEWGQKEKDTVLLGEYVRSSLRRQISHKFRQGKNVLVVYLFEPEVEEAVRKAIRQTSGGSYLALDPNIARQIVQNVKKEVGNIQSLPDKPVLLVSLDIRRYVRKLIEQEMYDLFVLSYQELTEDITIQPLGRIRL